MNSLLIKALTGQNVHVANGNMSVVGTLVDCGKDYYHVWGETALNGVRNGFHFSIDGVNSISSVSEDTVVIHLK